ncbi:MAG: hypothetical protein ACMUEL_05465 [Flavobacteriales bacterium Tduv]
MLFNKLVSKPRSVVECAFGCVKRWFVSRNARYKGLARLHVQPFMEVMATCIVPSRIIMCYL